MITARAWKILYAFSQGHLAGFEKKAGTG